MPIKTYELSLPLPPLECSPNWRGHWAIKARATKNYRARCGLVFTGARVSRRIPVFEVPITVHLTFFLCRTAAAGAYIPRDADNARAACKALMDSMQDAGLIKTDSADNVKMGETILRTKARGKPEERHFGAAAVQVRIVGEVPT